MWPKIKKEIITLIRKKFPEFKIAKTDFIFPPNPEFGDLSLPCFSFAKQLKKSSAEIAKEFSEKIKPAGVVEKIAATGPYLNFFLAKEKITGLALGQILKEKKKYGDSKSMVKEMMMIEYVSPNANKPLHLGHLRNALIGEAVANIFEAVGAKVARTSLVNDRGAHICKSMVAYKHWGKNKTPKTEKIKGDHFVGNFYVMYSQKVEENKKLEDEARAMLEKWEAGDKNVLALWKKMTDWVLAGFAETYKRLGVKLEKTYFESKIYKEGKKIILDAVKSGKFFKDATGAVLAKLGNGLPDKVLLRADGTALYVTQDIYLAKLKFDEYKLTKSIYCVGSEQDLYLKQLFKILEILGYAWAKNLYHLSHGMIYLPEGKMKSRVGTVVDADDFMNKLEDYAAEEVKIRHDFLSEKETAGRAAEIALAALKYFILQVDPKTDMHFDPKKSLSFTGRTGPYLQYTHARICSILEKAKATRGQAPRSVSFDKLKEKWEYDLIIHLTKFSTILEEAAHSYNPAVLADYLYNLAKIFSDFYRDVHVLRADEKTKKARLALILAIKIVLAKGLNLLGIEAPDKM
jgi:arginyl-tRNA synthetase